MAASSDAALVGRRPPNDGALFQGSQWEDPRIVILAAIVILAFLVTCFVLVLSLIQHL